MVQREGSLFVIVVCSLKEVDIHGQKEWAIKIDNKYGDLRSDLINKVTMESGWRCG